MQRAHLLLAFTAQRVGEIVGATWEEVDLRAGVWSIPRERMKRKDEERGPHLVPIPPRLLALMQGVAQGRRRQGAIYVCPSPRSNTPVTREAVEKFYRRTLDLARKHGPHSWRSAFSTICRDVGKDADVIEAQLDHVVGNKVASAYDRSQRLDLRRDSDDVVRVDADRRARWRDRGVVFDGDAAIVWIETFCRVPKGPAVAQPMTLLPFQREILHGLFDSPTRRAIVSMGRQNAKDDVGRVPAVAVLVRAKASA